MKVLLTEWIVNLTLFSLISSLITKLLPGKTYIPYIRIFCGIMMIVTLFQPFFRLGNLEKEIEFRFMEELYEAERKQMENHLVQVEEEQKEAWEEQYKAYMEQHGSVLVKEDGEEQMDGMEEQD